MSRVYNFSPGPAMLPEAVMNQAHQEFLNWHGSGMSVMELSHRGADFERVAAESEQDLRDLLSIPDDYSVLFLQGGAQGQFAAIPLNLLGAQDKASYVDSGSWSNKAIQEAQKYAKVQVSASMKADHYVTLLDDPQWEIDDDSAYLYYCDNETIHGVEFPNVPDSRGVPLVCDASSNILSRPMDISRFGLVYACSQKNIAPAGLAVVIVKNALLEREAHPLTPNILNYAAQRKSGSMLNTPPTFTWYMAGLTFKWIKAEGGVKAMGELADRKAKKLYDFIDQSDFYANPVDPICRSRVSVPFTLKDDALDIVFLKESAEKGLANLKGHRSVGGMRASIYNAMPEAGVDALIQFMADFEKRYY